MLTFTQNRKVWWGDTLAGEINPSVRKGLPWSYLPNPTAARDVPDGLKEPLFYYRTQREIKSFLKRQTRLANSHRSLT